jgi:erythromycin esterase
VWEARHSALSIGDERLALRDRGMADNLDFVLDELHPGKRVMVWAHNFHIQHRGFAPDTTPTVPVRSTGTYMAERHRRELYTIGLYMYRGSAAGNTRAVYPVARAAPNGLEAILHRAPWKYAFVDLSRAPAGPGTSWMTRRIPSLTWGTTLEQLVPREEYDGIVFIDTTWPPAYITGR